MTKQLMFDTHAHLNFKAFIKTLPEVIEKARSAGVHTIVVPGTDIAISKRGIDIASRYKGVYAAAGIHPHHAFNPNNTDQLLSDLNRLIKNNNIVAIGEIGIDRHIYQKTRYENYHIDPLFLETQKELFISQIGIAIKHNKSLIIHNREASRNVLSILSDLWTSSLENRVVFHCSEPDMRLLSFAKEKVVFIGVDGDVTYSKKKQEFVRKVPLDMLVLETDSPFLLPEPFKSRKAYPNKPENIPVIAEFVAKLLDMDREKLVAQTTENAKRLFFPTF